MIALRIVSGVDWAVRWLSQVVLVTTGIALMIALGANVIARYVLAAGGFDWAQEVPERLFPWFIMAGVALAVQSQGHVAVEALLALLPRNGRRALLLGGHALVAASYLVLAQQAMVVAEIVAIEMSPVLGLSGSHGYWAVAGGCFLLVLGTIGNAVRIAILGPEALQQSTAESTVT